MITRCWSIQNQGFLPVSVISPEVPLETWLGMYLCYLTFMYMWRPVVFQVRVAGSKVTMMDVSATLREGKSCRNLPYGPLVASKMAKKPEFQVQLRYKSPWKNSFFPPKKKCIGFWFPEVPRKHLYSDKVIGRR